MSNIEKIHCNSIIGGKRKNALTEKYDIDKSGFVEIDEYLDKEASKGPKERKGVIDYNYQHNINIFNFFTLLKLKKMKPFEILCVPKFEILFNRFVERTTVAIDLYKNTYIVPDYIDGSIQYCRNIPGIRFVYFAIIIRDNRSLFTHTNIGIIDLKKKTLERFEPYGCDPFYDSKKVNRLFENKLLKKMGLSGYKYIGPENISKRLGIQDRADAFTGMCITISSMYLLTRVLNADLKQSKVIDYFLNMDKKKLKNKILRFAKYIEKTLKENSEIVNQMNHDLYNNVAKELKNKSLFR